MEKSTHRADVYELVLEAHPNAERLSIFRAEGYTVCVNTADWAGRKLAAFVQPDSLVNVKRDEFKWLDDGKTEWKRVRAKKLRGIVSYGFLIPVDHLNVNVGDDVAAMLDIKHYDPEEALDAGIKYKQPADFSKYDVDSFQKYHKLFVEGEKVRVSEKIHGQNTRFVYDCLPGCTTGEMRIGSRSYWKNYEPSCPFWKAFHSDERIEKFVRDNPNYTLFGESYGNNKGMRYGCVDGEIKFAGFDIMRPDGSFVDSDELAELSSCLPWVPRMPIVEYGFDFLVKLAEGKTLMPGADHMREGIVVSPLVERFDERLGRVKVKIINPEYLEKS